jgi:hypothetical protein
MSGSSHQRNTDPLIFEMHGMIKELCVTVKDHIKRDEEIQAQHHTRMVDVEKDLKPVVEFHKSAQTVGDWLKWVAKYMSIPALTGLGIGAWAWFKVAVSHVSAVAHP